MQNKSVEHNSNATQISDILKDRNQQGKVVNNVMKFFRFKDIDKFGSGSINSSIEQKAEGGKSSDDTVVIGQKVKW